MQAYELATTMETLHHCLHNCFSNQ